MDTGAVVGLASGTARPRIRTRPAARRSAVRCVGPRPGAAARVRRRRRRPDRHARRHRTRSCPGVPLVGCSSELLVTPDSVAVRGVVVTALGGPGFLVRTGAGSCADGAQRAGGAQAARCVAGLEPDEAGAGRALVLLTDGWVADQEEILAGAYGVVGASMPMVGGSASPDPAVAPAVPAARPRGALRRGRRRGDRLRRAARLRGAARLAQGRRADDRHPERERRRCTPSTTGPRSRPTWRGYGAPGRGVHRPHGVRGVRAAPADRRPPPAGRRGAQRQLRRRPAGRLRCAPPARCPRARWSG